MPTEARGKLIRKGRGHVVIATKKGQRVIWVMKFTVERATWARGRCQKREPLAGER